MRIRDLKVLDVFQFNNEEDQVKNFGKVMPRLMMDDLTGDDVPYTTYCVLCSNGTMGRGFYRTDNPEVTRLGNAKELYPKRYKDWYNWRK